MKRLIIFILFVLPLILSANQSEKNVNDRNPDNTAAIETLSLNPDWEVLCDQEWSRYGDGISAGDINGDGFDDVVVGAPAYQPGGAVFVYLGSAFGPSEIPDKVLYGEGIGFGNRVDCKGDVNQDGYKDLIVGDPFWYGGRVLIYHGSPSGFPDSANMEVRSFWSGGQNFGFTVSSGDVNGDGYSDLIAGIYNELYPPSLNVVAYVFPGSASGINWYPEWIGTVPVNEYDSWSVVSNAGDVNGDGFDDVVTGIRNSKTVLIYFGSPVRQYTDSADCKLTNPVESFGLTAGGAGDVNSDGYDDIVIGSQAGSVFVYYGSQNGPSLNYDWMHSGADNCYGYMGTSAGDFNSDGFNDMVVSICSNSFHLFFGSNSGLPDNPVIMNSLNYYLSSGDVNGDGYSDVLSSREPRAYGFFGSADRVNSLYITPEDTVLQPYPGTEICFNSLVKSQYEFPMPGVTVNFTVNGVNSVSGTSVSDSNGIAMICYICNSVFTIGRDTIIATAADKTDTAFVFWDLPLPAEITLFTSSVSGRDVTLNWTTASELNNSGFDIERSSADNLWIKAGTVNGHGTVSEPVSYTFTDRNLSTGKYNYRLKQLDFNGNIEYFELAEEINIGIPVKYELSQNYPNPFNPVTTINYDLPEDGIVTIKIYDILGRQMKTLVNEMKTAGYHKIQFNAADLSSGAYFYRMTVGDYVAVKKFVVMK